MSICSHSSKKQNLWILRVRLAGKYKIWPCNQYTVIFISRCLGFRFCFVFSLCEMCAYFKLTNTQFTILDTLEALFPLTLATIWELWSMHCTTVPILQMRKVWQISKSLKKQKGRSWSWGLSLRPRLLLVTTVSPVLWTKLSTCPLTSLHASIMYWHKNSNLENKHSLYRKSWYS